MHTRSYFKSKVFNLDSPERFEKLALELFHYQAEHNPVYRQYLLLLNVKIARVVSIAHIPFLPIRFFKSQRVISQSFAPQLEFHSSGTTGSRPSRHYVREAALYRHSFAVAFRQMFNAPQKYFIAALLPSYLERQHSSLVYMCKNLIEESGAADSGFFLNNLQELQLLLEQKKQQSLPIMLIGVSFALMEMAEKYPVALRPGDVVMETGGMKGRRKELTRQELHQQLKQGFKVPHIASEYGMTELLSQAYARQDGLFEPPPWMQVRIRELNDPFAERPEGKTGALNIIDLANLDSCAFIETEDLARSKGKGRFEVLGRFDTADLRGCNLLLG